MLSSSSCDNVVIDWHSKDLSNFLLFSWKKVVVMTPLFKLLLKFSFKFGRPSCQWRVGANLRNNKHNQKRGRALVDFNIDGANLHLPNFLLRHFRVNLSVDAITLSPYLHYMLHNCDNLKNHLNHSLLHDLVEDVLGHLLLNLCHHRSGIVDVDSLLKMFQLSGVVQTGDTKTNN